jgi:hypothetical protein
MNQVERLEWDSEFFGVELGRVELDGVDQTDLDLIDEQGRDMGLACLFGTIRPGAGDSSVLAQAHGHRLVEVAIRFDRRPGPYVPPPSRSVVRHGGPEDMDMLSDALDRLAPWSRFAVDERFGLSAARRMYEAWVRRAVDESGERFLAIAEDEDGLTGLSTNVRTPVPRVDLLAVTKPGTGASQAMMSALFEWAGDTVTQAGPCAARNLSVIRFVEGCGFSACETHYLFHRWLDDSSRARG